MYQIETFYHSSPFSLDQIEHYSLFFYLYCYLATLRENLFIFLQGQCPFIGSKLYGVPSFSILKGISF